MTETGDETLKRIGGENLGLTPDMRRLAAPGVQVWSNTGYHVTNQQVWSGQLKVGAIIGLGAHSAIFTGYSKDVDGNLQVNFWDDHNLIYKYREDENNRSPWVKPNQFHGGNWY